MCFANKTVIRTRKVGSIFQVEGMQGILLKLDNHEKMLLAVVLENIIFIKTYKKMLCKYAANLQVNTYAEI